MCINYIIYEHLLILNINTKKKGVDTILEMNRTHIIYSMVDMLERS